MDPLATLEEVTARMKRQPDAQEQARLEKLLVDASAKVRAYTRQTISPATTTARFRVQGGKVNLWERPVTEVTTVVDLDGNDLDFDWDETYGSTVDLLGTGIVVDFADWPCGRLPAWVKVTYEHGFDPVPDEIVAVVCQITIRAFGLDPEDSGRAGEAIDGYSYTLGSAGAAGGLGLLPDERDILDRYRPPGIGTVAIGTDR